MIRPPDDSGRGLHAPVQFLKGVGPRRASALREAGIETLYDLLFTVPRRHLDRSQIVSIAELRDRLRLFPAQTEGEGLQEERRDYTVVGEVRSFRVLGAGRKARFVLVLADPTGSMQLVWFGGVQYWRNAFSVGERLAASGQPAAYGSVLQFVHPDLDRFGREAVEESAGADRGWDSLLHTGRLVPLYPSSQELARVGLDSAGFRRLVDAALRGHLGEVAETLPRPVLEKRGLVGLAESIRTAHFPDSREALAGAMERLSYEELFIFQVRLALQRRWTKEGKPGIAFDVRSRLARRLVDGLPFSLTPAQVRVIREITADMESPQVMNRLLQGDVGSGKTIVALTAMLIAVENGYQAALMAPTEILAEQHHRTLLDRLEGLPVQVRLLRGTTKSRQRRTLLGEARDGTAQILVGTHALFEKEVEFARLGLVVIDEQHRFGVLQRALLREKGENPDVLVMTATPIPRTLSLTLYGDLDVSVIDAMPPGRSPVRTVLKPEREKEEVRRFVREQIREGRQAYFVYPLIEESAKVDLKAATVHYEELRDRVFPDLRLGMIHGRMAGDEREATMRRFKEGGIDLLVATTVIEVGIDVPNASVMVIENAERFGLSQLHQLRGRVGRGPERSTCILLAADWAVRSAARGGRRGEAVTDTEEGLAGRRLATMVETTDGFRIAEVDLGLRGPGDYFGTRQSGAPAFRVADLLRDGDLLRRARDDAFEIVARDPHLRLAEHRPLLEHLRTHLRDTMRLMEIG